MNLRDFANRIALKATMGERDGFVARETEEYLTKLEEHMIATRPSKTDLPCDYRSFDGFKDGYAVAVERMLKFLRNGELEATET
jgi:hypothetical protein